jgi:hypothetical protein
MSTPLTIECQVHFKVAGRGGRKQLQRGEPTQLPPVEVGRVPRVARLMALAIRFDTLVHQGEIASYAELARLGHVTRARVSQIMNLLHLAPDIQEALLFLPRTVHGRDPLILSQLQPIAAVLDWRQQRLLWQELLKASYP